MTDSPCAGPSDPWDTRFGFFWYNDQEIFHSTQDDLNRQAESFAEAGINHVITFSCTHFRWSFRRYWDRLTETLARVVQACHRHGICVTEHHSSHLTFNPLNEADERYMERILRVRGSSLASWPGLREDCDRDPLVGGVPLSSFRQIDGRTGHWARSAYRGWCMCYNNPDYRRAYLSYLEMLYRVGIDGIMTDDVQWFGEGHACACPHCRRLFREQSGYELPSSGPDWAAWHGSYDPAYVAWLDFRFRSNEDFHRAVKAHYEGLGLRPLRPNYVSHALNRNWTGYTLETLPDLDWVFQESCFSTIIRYSWPSWAIEAAHRFAVGRRRQIPPMTMFYPDRPDALLFTWALAMSWGQLYLATPEGFSLTREEKRLRAFEKAHAPLLRNPRKLARLGFYDARPNRYFYQHAESRSLAALKTWMQACYRSNVPCDLFQMEERDRLDRYAVVVLNEVAILSNDELDRFRRYVGRGGTLVWTGRTGTQGERGLPRPAESLARLWELDSALPVEDRQATLVHHLGAGRLVLVAGDWGLGPFEPEHVADRWQAEEIRVPFRAVSDEEKKTWRQITGLLVGLLPGGPDLVAENLARDVIVTAYQSADGTALVLHLVNAAGTLAVDPGAPVGHSDTIPFPPHERAAPIRLHVRKPSSMPARAAAEARYYDPEVARALTLPVVETHDTLSVELDPSALRGYGLLSV